MLKDHDPFFLIDMVNMDTFFLLLSYRCSYLVDVSCPGDSISRCVVACCGFYLAVVSCIFLRIGVDRSNPNPGSGIVPPQKLTTMSVFINLLGTCLPFMTGRRNPPPRPTTPPDPTLESRPPPSKCRFAIRSSGPAAAADIKQERQPLRRSTAGV